MEPYTITTNQNSLPKVEAFLSAVGDQTFFKDESVEGSILWHIAFYKIRAPRRRLLFRACGFTLLFLSISLPFLTQIVPKEWQSHVASTLAWTIALVAATNSFFNWQKGWQGFIQAQLTLQFALSEWELRTAEARAAATDEQGLALLKAGLEKLTKTVTEVISAETAGYFEDIKIHDAQTKSKS